MKTKLILFFSLVLSSIYAQENTSLKLGDKAPDFILTVDNNTIQSYLMPYMKRITLLHFWSNTDSLAKNQNKNLNRLFERYQNSSYTNADGFEIISIAIQNDIDSWKASIKNDSLTNFGHGIALKGFEDEVCLKFNVKRFPTDILIDETGKIIAINPRMVDVETILDDRKNFHAVKNDVVGFLAQSSNKNEVLKFSKLYLFNYYGDSISKSQTDANGRFTLHNVKLNQVFILKVDNQSNIITSDPLALYSSQGEFIMDGKTHEGGFVFNIAPRLSNKLSYKDTAHFKNTDIGQIDVVKSLSFANEGQQLTPKDIQEINPILVNLQKNTALKLEFTTHTDSQIDSPKAIDITTHQVNAIKTYLEKKGIDISRLNGIAMGNSEPRKQCEGVTDCNENDHKLNRRVEFILFRD